MSVISAGWLGVPLGQELHREGARVLAGYRREEAKEELRAKGLLPHKFVMNEGRITDAGPALFSCDLGIITLPPSAWGKLADGIIHGVNELSSRLQTGGCHRVILVSSTGVYPDDNHRVSDVNMASPHSDRAKVLLQIEDQFREHWKENLSVLRLAGLAGPDRNPGRWFAGRKGIPAGDAPVNLIHLADCIRAIRTIIEKDLFGETFHLSASRHPAKKDFYPFAAAKGGYEVPEFDPGEGKGWKIVDPAPFLEVSGMELLYPDPFEFPEFTE